MRTPSRVGKSGASSAARIPTNAIWSDSRGVFALVVATCNSLANVPCGQTGTSLQFNDGSGWNAAYTSSATAPLYLTGFDGGDVVLSAGACGIQFVDPTTGTTTCPSSSPAHEGVVFVVNATNAYGYWGTQILHFDGAQWSPFAQLPTNASSLWADDQVAIAVGYGQAIYFKAGGSTSFQVLPSVPAGDYTSVWAFSASDIWAGNTAGQLVHYDGSQWTVIETGTSDTSGITQLWGASSQPPDAGVLDAQVAPATGHLYFRTNSEFGVWKGTVPELLLTQSNPQRITITGMWGNSPSEVFLSIGDAQYQSDSCNGFFLVYYDGSQFHEF